MNAKSKRPALIDLDSMIVKASAAGPAASLAAAEPDVKPAPSKSASVPASETFRTSIYFSRAVHDKLRDIAHEERKTITDLINEGLDHVLTKRNYPTTQQLKKSHS